METFNLGFFKSPLFEIILFILGIGLLGFSLYCLMQMWEVVGLISSAIALVILLVVAHEDHP